MLQSGPESRKAIDAAVSAIEKQFGKGVIMRLGEKNPLLDKLEVIPTGCLSLDIALGIGGLPRGRIIEIYGPESSGKTTMALHLIAEAQKKGGVAAFVDAEHALDTKYAKLIGVKLEDLLVSQPDTGEQALDVVDTLVRSNACDVIVVDSVAALTPKAEIEGDMGDHHVGLQARLMSQALRKLTASVAKSSCVVLFINQLRMKIGVMFGNPETTTGGNALKFYSSVRLDIRRVASVKQADEVIGNRVKVKVVKNKVAAPFKIAEFDIMFNSGVSRIGDLIDLAVAKNIVAKTGAWFSYNEERLGQGRENSKEFLEQNPKIVAEIEKKVYEAYGVEVVGAGKGDKAEKSSKEDKAERAGAVADRAEVVADKDDDKKAVKAAQPVAAATKVKKPMAASK
jgi:recombination protein RecA